MTDAPDILAHFGLTTIPFTREFPIEKRYIHPQYEELLSALLLAIENRMSAAVIAPCGAGKTVLMRALRDQLPEARYRFRYTKVTSLSKRDMCREIATVIGCQPAGQLNTLVHSIQSHMLNSLDNDGVRPVLIIDEGHELRFDVLAMLRLLTNFDMDSRLVVSIILCGQKGLAHMLAHEDMEALSRRLTHIGTLRNLSREETRLYIQHRMTMVNSKSDPFSSNAYSAIFEIGHGNLRATNRLALKSLQFAAHEQSEGVDQTHVAKARERLWA